MWQLFALIEESLQRNGKNGSKMLLLINGNVQESRDIEKKWFYL